MFTKRVALLLTALLFGISYCACASAATPSVDTPAPAAAEVTPESVVLAIVTPVPTPTLSPSPTPSPEPTGRALRAWQLLEKERAYLTEHPPANGDIEGTLATMMIDADKKLIALTFDDGPSNQNTNRILDVLEKYHARATFFVIGKRIQNHEAVIARAISLGCEIGTHTWGHSDFTKYPKSALVDSLEKVDEAMFANFDYHITLFRPPYASIDKNVEDAAKDMGYKMVLWSGSSHDWSIKDVDKIYKNTFACAADGAIVLFHDIYPFTAEAIERIVPDLISQGYQLVTVSELMAMDEKTVEPGERYGGWAEPVKVLY
jgi:peptidoglycan/xylan/chitin deacetylase (PgdA/CDA1 family)